MPVNFLNAVLIVSEDAPRLADWYREILGLPLQDEKHGDRDLHFGCNMRGLHFAIHPISNYSFAPDTGPGGVRIAFNVSDIAGFAASLADKGVNWVFEPVDLGWSKMLALRDPDGNIVEILQMTPHPASGNRD
jgi:catechol 2,3-dioxygenase-like lactoylglutathione lyase family enzyme